GSGGSRAAASTSVRFPAARRVVVGKGARRRRRAQVSKLWSRSAGGDEFEDALRRNRPQPREEFLRALEARGEADAQRTRGRRARLVFAGAFVAVSLTA